MITRTRIGIVIPVYGNAPSLRPLHERLLAAFQNEPIDLTIVFVNDRSLDDSQKILEEMASEDCRVKVILLSKNHGAFVAIVAGLSHVRHCDAVGILSADLQDPPEALPALLAQWRMGAPVVLGVRQKRGDSWIVRLSSGLFHKLFRKFVMPEMPEGGFDFCLIDQKVIDVLIRSAEKNTSLTGLIIWSGFERAYVPYVRAERPHGKSMWSLRKKIRFAINSVISFTAWPLKLFGVLGIALGLFCLISAITIFIRYFVCSISIPGWTSLIFTMLTLFSFQFIGLAVLGEYFWISLDQNRKRPLFIVDRKIGFECEAKEPAAESHENKEETVPLFSLQSVSKPVLSSLTETCIRVLRGRQIILGPEVHRFERDLAAYLGVRHVVGVANGTDAITLALWAAGVNAGDEVITAGISAPATAVAILRAGAKPVYVDINSGDLTMSPESLEKAIRPTVKALVPVHLYGNPCKMNEIMRIAQKHHLPVVEDCAQSLGSTFDGKHCGSIGLLGAFSFYPTKNLGGYGDGGAIATNDPKLAENLKQMRFYGQNGNGECVLPGFNSRLDEMQAALLSERLKILDFQNNERVQISSLYCKELSFLSPIVSSVGGVPHLFVVRPSNRLSFCEFLKRNNIQTGIHYHKALTDHAYLRQQGSDAGTQEARRQCEHVVSLPCYPGLAHDSVREVIRICKAWYSLNQ